MLTFSGKGIRLCALLLCISVPTGVFAEVPASYRVHVAVSLDAPSDLITNAAICENNKICNVVSDQARGIDVTLKLHSNATSSFGELTVRCKDECSFDSGKNAIIFTKDRIFEFFQGRDAMEIPLVLKPRTKIGEISLIIEQAQH